MLIYIHRSAARRNCRSGGTRVEFSRMQDLAHNLRTLWNQIPRHVFVKSNQSLCLEHTAELRVFCA